MHKPEHVAKCASLSLEPFSNKIKIKTLRNFHFIIKKPLVILRQIIFSLKEYNNTNRGL